MEYSNRTILRLSTGWGEAPNLNLLADTRHDVTFSFSRVTTDHLGRVCHLVKVGRESMYVPATGSGNPVISINHEEQINSEIEIIDETQYYTQ